MSGSDLSPPPQFSSRGLLVFGGLSLGKFLTLLCHIAGSANGMLF